MNSHRTKLAILLWSATPARPELCAAPFVHAALAAALDCEVEIHFSGDASRLLVAGVAEHLFATPDSGTSIYTFMQEAARLGVRFLVCAMAQRAHIEEREATVPEFTGIASATAFLLRTLDPEWATLVF